MTGPPLDPAHWARVRALFDAAATLDPEARRAWLDVECAGDPALRAEVESLLSHSGETAAVEGAIASAIDARDDDRQSADAGRTLGPYRLVEPIGAGGMGTVWLAERTDGAFEKRVALKLVRGGLADPHLAARLRAERRILAGLEHPGIARILDGGETGDGVPYIVLEHVAGRRVDDYCREQRLSIHDRLQLFLEVCDAVDYAHRRLVIHRDLKPANILVTSDGHPKLLDFGIAKLVAGEASGMTRTGIQPMTPEYAAPEQIRGEPVGVATDVFALGVLLYELLSGAHPFRTEGASARDLEGAVLDTDPPPPGELARRAASGRPHEARRIAGEIDDIVLMAIRKDPSERYATVAELAADIRRHLDGLPVAARPATLRYRAGKFVRRHAVAVGATGVVMLALLAATTVSTVLYLRAERAQRNSATVNAFLEDMLGSVDPRIAQGRDVTLLRELLDTSARRIEREFPDDPRTAATLRLVMGRTYRSIAAHEASERHLRFALEAREAGDADERAIAEARHDLGMLLLDTSRLSEADSLLSLALATRRRHVESDPSSYLETLSQLALVRQAAGDEVEPLLREASNFAGAHFGERSPVFAEHLTTLGGYLSYRDWQAGKLETPVPELIRAVGIWRELDAPDPFMFAYTLHAAGVMYRDLGDHAAAEPLFREAIDLRRRLLGEDHPLLAVSYQNLAQLEQERGNVAEAERLYLETLRIQRALGDDNMDVATTRNNLGTLLRNAGRYREAAAHLSEAARIYREVLGPEHAWLAFALGNLARTWSRAGDCAAAEPVVDEFDRIASRHWEPHQWPRYLVEDVRGRCLTREGRYADAEDLLLGAYRGALGHRGQDHDDTRQAAASLVALYEAWGRPGRAEPYRAVAAPH